jgi:fermentation-respiration switch protein FrsA (DUF1100 family)
MTASRPGRRYWLRLTGFTLLLAALVSGGLLASVAYVQEQGFLHPERHVSDGALLRAMGVQFEPVALTAEDGVRLRAWYTPSRNGTVILVAHGHAASIPEDVYALFARNGFGVLAWDFRAHGESEGRFTSLGYYEVLDVQAALDYALAQPGVERVGGWGGSMGAATMILAAAQSPRIEAVVADSAYASLDDQLDLRVPVPVLRGLIRAFAELETGAHIDQVRPVDAIARLSPRPVFIIQGLSDDAIPSDSAQRLFDAAGEPRQLWTEENAYHLNMFVKFPRDYEELVIDFFNDAWSTEQ